MRLVTFGQRTQFVQPQPDISAEPGEVRLALLLERGDGLVVGRAADQAAEGRHLACARFLAGDKGAISGGGADRTLMRWNLVAAPPHDPGGAGGAGAGGASRAAWKPQGRGNAGMRPWWGGDHQDVRM